MAEYIKLIKSFNTDFFLKDSTNASTQVLVRVKPGYEKSVYINGQSLGRAFDSSTSVTNDMYIPYGSVVSDGSVDVFVEPSNIITKIITDSSNTISSIKSSDVSTSSPVKIQQDQQVPQYVKMYVDASYIVDASITSSDEFWDRFRKPDSGQIVGLIPTVADSSFYPATLLDISSAEMSGIKYISGSVKVACKSIPSSGIKGIVINPKEISGDIKGWDERKIFFTTSSVVENKETIELDIVPDGQMTDLSVYETLDVVYGDLTFADLTNLYTGKAMDGEFYSTNTHQIPDTSNMYKYAGYIVDVQSDETGNEPTEIDPEFFVNGKILHVHIDSDDDVWVDFYTKEEGEQEPTFQTNIEFNIGGEYETALERKQKLIDNNTSFEILRVNPRLTGNIKVVVDSDSNLYLDTFKVSKSLSNIKYRKIKVNPSEYYGRTLMAKFKNVPSDDLYKVEDFCSNVISYTNTPEEQYYDKYNSGVRTNSDKLYSENFAMLAPLKIKKELPDFFLVFKVKPENGKYYSSENNDAGRIKYFLEKGELIKAYDMREGTNIGTYIRNIYKNAKGFAGDVYVSNEYSKENAYNGISLERGVVAKIYESGENLKSVTNQVAMNDWFTDGFKRNRLVAKDIINFEFMFDDTTENLFSLNTYFGLYVRLNGEPNTFTCVGISQAGYPQFDTSISGRSFNPASSDNAEIIYGISDPDKFVRLKTNIQSADSSAIMSEYALKPHTMIASANVVDIPDEFYNNAHYVSILFNDTLEPGEHFRLIDKTNRKIYEVIVSNVENEYFDISETARQNININGSTYTIFSKVIYGIPYRTSIPEDQKESLIKAQLNLLSVAFNEFGYEYITSYNDSKQSLSVLYKRGKLGESTNNSGTYDSNILFEKVNSAVNILNESVSELNEIDKSCLIFGIEDIPQITLHWDTSYANSYLLPYGFEVMGDRTGYCACMIPLDVQGDEKSYIVSSDMSGELNATTTVLYKYVKDASTKELGTSEYTGFDVLFMNDMSTPEPTSIKKRTIIGFGQTETYLLKFNDYDKLPLISSNTISFFDNTPINAGVCSIFPIKDLYTDILDAFTSLDGDVYVNKSTRGEYTIPDVLSTAAIPTILDSSYTEDNFAYYISKDGRFGKTCSYDPSIRTSPTIENAQKYNNGLSDIPIMAGSCLKWKTLGTDKFGKMLRFMFDTSISDYNVIRNLNKTDNDYYIGFLTTNPDSIPEEIQRTSPKYINTRSVYSDHPKYLDYVLYGDGKINDLLYTEYSHVEKFSTAYKIGKGIIEFISGGVKVSLETKLPDILNMSKYDGYSAILIASAGNNSIHSTPINVIIDEIDKEIAVIYYNGTMSDDLVYDNTGLNVYTKENSGIEAGKEYVFSVPNDGVDMNDTELNYFEELKPEMIPDSSYNDGSVLYSVPGTIYAASIDEGSLVFQVSGEKNRSSYTRDSLNETISKLLKIDASGAETYGTLDTYDWEFFVDSSRIGRKQSDISNKFKDEQGDIFVYDSSVFSDSNSGYRKTVELNSIENLCKDGTNNTGVIIKTEGGTLDYTTLNDIMYVKITGTGSYTAQRSGLPDSSNAYPTYIEPVYMDMMNFAYDETTLSTMFNKTLSGCNIRVSDIRKIDQVFIKKYSDRNITSGVVGITPLFDISLVQNCFECNLFKNYKGTQVSESTLETSKTTGYEKNTFLSSRGINLNGIELDGSTNGNKIWLTEWKETKLSGNKLTLNVTETLINAIMMSPGFESIWENVEIDILKPQTKRLYITNTILKYVVVTDKNSVLINRRDADTTSFVQGWFDGEEIKNAKGRLYVENNITYLEIDLPEKYEYCVKLEISL